LYAIGGNVVYLAGQHCWVREVMFTSEHEVL
jgi:hypothetical protein